MAAKQKSGTKQARKNDEAAAAVEAAQAKKLRDQLEFFAQL